MRTTTEDRPAAATKRSTSQPDHYIAPLVNIMEDKEGYLLEAEMPGVTKDGLELLLEGNELTLVGHKHQNGVNAEPLYRESTSRDYRRVFVLDPAIDAQKISAHIDQGVLRLSLPKAERVKPRKIEVLD